MNFCRPTFGSPSLSFFLVDDASYKKNYYFLLNYGGGGVVAGECTYPLPLLPLCWEKTWFARIMVIEHPDTALRLGDAPNGKSFMFFSVISISENHNPLAKGKTFCFNLVIRSEEMCSWFILCEEKGGIWFILLQLNIIIVKPVICRGWGSAKGVNVTSLFLDKYCIKNKTTRHAPKCQWQVIVRMHVHLTVTLVPYHQ